VDELRADTAARGAARANVPVRAADGIARARRLVTEVGRDAGVEGERMALLNVAVSEAVTNALVHGGGAAEVEVTGAPDGVTVTVRDHGPGMATLGATARPAPDRESGRGLWLARRFCDRMDIATSGFGTRVTLHVDR